MFTSRDSRRAASLIAVVSAAAVAAPGHAQEVESAEIIVTAQKRQQSLSDVPMSITAISGENLTARGVTDVQGLAKLTPGLSVAESGNSVPVYSLRGIGFFDTAVGARPTVSVYVDEVSLPFSIMTQGASFDLERVEVLKGPQGTLFGQNATGGAINYIAAKPRDTLQAGFNGSFGRFNDLDVTGFITGPLSETMKARVAVRGNISDDWQKSYTRDDSLGQKKFLQGRFILDWEPADTVRLSFNANGFLDHGDTQAPQLLQVLPQAPSRAARIPLIVNYPVSPERPRAADWDDEGFPLRKDNEFYQLSLRGDVDLSDDVTLTSLTAWSRMDISQRNDLDGTAVTAGRNHVRAVVSSLSQELRLAGKLDALQWVVGANYARDKANESTFLENLYTTATYAIPTGLFLTNDLFSDQRFVSKAVFGNVDYELTSQLTAHAGVRYTDAKLDYRSCSKVGDAVTASTLTSFYNILRAGASLPPLSPIAAGQCISLNAGLTPELRVGELDEDNVSWRVGLDFKPAPRTLIYANVSRGYKGGSNPVIGALSAAQLTPVTQESVTAYEIGFKAPIADRLIELSGAAFYYDYKDKQLKGRIFTTPNIFGALEGLVNVPKSWVKGVELQANIFPVRGLNLMLGGTYLDTKVTSDFSNYTITGQLANFEGNPFPYTPKWQLVADASYERPITDDLKAVVGASANYRSKTRAGFGDEEVLNIASYTLVDARVGVKSSSGWEVGLFARNLFNEYYWTNVARYLDTTRRFAGMPRTFGVQVGYRFN